jgi:hypothetical protein
VIGVALSSQSGRWDATRYARVVVLDDDYALRMRLRESAPPGVAVEGLGDALDRLYAELQPRLARALAEIAGRTPPEVWWSGQVASRSSTATSVMRNMIYARFARDVALGRGAAQGDVLFVCADAGLLRCLVRLLREAGVPVRREGSRLGRLGQRLGRLAYGAALAGCTILEFFRTRRMARQLPMPAGLDQPKKRALLRTWISDGAFAEDGTYRDRQFGALPQYLRDRGYDVLFVPMFVSLQRPLADWFRRMARSGERFLVPHHVAGWRALAGQLRLEVRRLFVRCRGARVDGIDISDILRYEAFRHAFDPSMVRLNLAAPMIAALARRGVRIDLVAYPFENNASEKPFLLALRRHYLKAETLGFQHGVWLSRQAGAEIVAEELPAHPLPDRIVSSGPAYVGILAGLGFPRDRLAAGPSLRFASIRDYPVRAARPPDRPPVLYLALPYDRNMSFELLDKLRAALGDDWPCHVRIKRHPLMREAELAEALDRLRFPSVERVDGPCRDDLLAADAALAVGTSVVAMEAIACGTPLVRVVPENTFFLDPMKWMDYPVPPARTPAELRGALRQALAMKPDDLAALAREVKRDYFEAVTAETMAVFDAGGRPAQATVAGVSR